MNQSMRRVAVCLLVVSSVLSPEVYGAKVEKRVVFEKGKTSATYTGKLPRQWGDYDAYFFRAKAGQTLTIKLTSDDPNAYLAVFETKELGPAEDTILANDEKSRQWSGKLPITSEYSVQVYGVSSSDQNPSGAPYTIEIGLRQTTSKAISDYGLLRISSNFELGFLSRELSNPKSEICNWYPRSAGRLKRSRTE